MFLFPVATGGNSLLAVGYQAVFGMSETVSRIVCIAVLQNVGTLFINLETFLCLLRDLYSECIQDDSLSYFSNICAGAGRGLS